MPALAHRRLALRSAQTRILEATLAPLHAKEELSSCLREPISPEAAATAVSPLVVACADVADLQLARAERCHHLTATVLTHR